MKRIILLLIVQISLFGCVTTTKLSGTWTTPDIPAKRYQKIMVAALTQNLLAKQTVENDFAAKLSVRGVQVGVSHDVFAPNFTDDHIEDKNAMLGKLREDDYEGILTVSLIDKRSETRYVPGSYSYRPVSHYVWYGRFWRYYTTMYPMIYEPGYYTEDKVYFIETNLYDVETEKLIWSAQSETYNPSDLEQFSDEFTTLIIEELQKTIPLGS